MIYEGMEKKVEISAFSVVGQVQYFAMYDSYFMKFLEGKGNECCINYAMAQRSCLTWSTIVYITSSLLRKQTSQPLLSISKLLHDHQTHHVCEANMCMCAKLLQSSPILCDPMDCNPPCCSVHVILQARIPGVGCHSLFQGIFPTQGSNLHLFMPPALAGGFFTTGKHTNYKLPTA